MANQVAARLAGDDYQHLYAWWHSLGLYLSHLELAEVCIEDERAGSFDDVTLRFAPGTGRANHFVQVKYHVDQRSAYSTAVLLERRGNASSLLQKFWRTWQALRHTGTQPELTLYSNWSWDSTDAIGNCISGKDGALTEAFLTEGPRTHIGQLREQWIAECQATPAEFAQFVGCLRFRLGSTNVAADVTERTVERMNQLGLRCDEAALLLAAGVVRDWIKDGVRSITRAVLESVISALDLRAPPAESTTTVYLETIKKRRFDLKPDYFLDWRDYFAGSEFERGHAVLDPSSWNGRMLPKLQALEEQINRERAPRLIRARGLSRLSAWFAFGKVFSRVAGYEIEVQQGSARWRTDAPPANDFSLVSTALPGNETHTRTLAVGLSITGSLRADLTHYLDSIGFGGPVLLLEPAQGPAREVFRGAGDVVAFTNEAKTAIRRCIDEVRVSDIMLFYFGPLSGACFLGHDLNAIGARITIMEDQSPGYASAFVLT